jgi:hypothetical protein
MILPNFRPAYLTPIKIKSGSTPVTANWSDITFDKSEEKHTVTEQRITGLSSPITLSLQWSRAAETFLFYRISPTPLPEGLTIYNIKSLNAPVGEGLTFDPYNEDESFPLFRDPCAMSHGFTSAGAYPADSCDEIIINNNDYVAFIYFAYSTPFSPYPFNTTVTIGNLSDPITPNATVDTFTCTAQA